MALITVEREKDDDYLPASTYSSRSQPKRSVIDKYVKAWQAHYAN